ARAGTKPPRIERAQATREVVTGTCRVARDRVDRLRALRTRARSRSASPSGLNLERTLHSPRLLDRKRGRTPRPREVAKSLTPRSTRSSHKPRVAAGRRLSPTRPSVK